SLQEGWWTKIGRVVVVSGRIVLSAKGTWPADLALVLGGMPFPVMSGDASAGAIHFQEYSGLAIPWAGINGTPVSDPQGFLRPGFPTSSAEQIGGLQTSPLEANSLTDSTDLAFAGHYLTEEEPTPPPGPGEGSWTPELIGLEGQSGQSYARQVAFYTRVGSVVFVYGDLRLSARGNFGSTIGIGGLPFPVVESNF